MKLLFISPVNLKLGFWSKFNAQHIENKVASLWLFAINVGMSAKAPNNLMVFLEDFQLGYPGK